MGIDLVSLSIMMLAVALVLRFSRRTMALLRRRQEARDHAALVQAMDWTRDRRAGGLRRSKLDKLFFS